MAPSSSDLHPRYGARFELLRTSLEPLTYRVAVYLPEGVRFETDLSWTSSEHPHLASVPDDPWVRDETLKLARVLKRTPQARLLRWRDRDAEPGVKP